MGNWKCKRCGKCCRAVPCMFAQVKFNLTKENRLPCPSLVMEGSRYKCLEMKRGSSIFRQMLGDGCDNPEYPMGQIEMKLVTADVAIRKKVSYE